MTATQEEIAAAWSAWQSRHGGKLGPGPAFVEAINAALALRLPTLESLQRENEEKSELARAFEAEANQLREVSVANRRRAEAAEAEVKHYRAALYEIATNDEYRILTAEEAQTVAQKALASTGGKP